MTNTNRIPCSVCSEPTGYSLSRLKTLTADPICQPCRRKAREAVAPSRIQTWTCQRCGKECSRVRVRGQVPRNCSDECRDAFSKYVSNTCKQCGKDYTSWGKEFCSQQCSKDFKAPVFTCKTCSSVLDSDRGYCSPQCFPSQQSPLRLAYESEDWGEVIVALKEKTSLDDAGCWVWQGRLREGYGSLRIAKKDFAAHRLMMEAVHEAPLGVQPVHHKCANRACINPKHLQPVTHHDNVAEMLARQAMTDRIAELEAAIREMDPTHPVLHRVPML